VLRLNGEQLGYLRAEVANDIADGMDQGMQFRARAESIAGRDEGTLGVNVSFIYCDGMPAIPAVERPAPAKSPALSIGGCVLVLVAVLFSFSLYVLSR